MRLRFFYGRDVAAGLADYLSTIGGMATHRPLNIWLYYSSFFRGRMAHADADERSWLCDDRFIMSEILGNYQLRCGAGSPAHLTFFSPRLCLDYLQAIFALFVES